MKEEFLHYIWKYKLFNKNQLKTTDNQKLEIISQGTHNYDSGPDFFNAKIKIGETTWAGNVEIHKRSSDWYLHKHHENRAYDNVVLQVVHKHDKNVERTNGQQIPTLEIDFNNRLLNNYKELMSEETWASCENKIPKVDSFLVQHWLETLSVERLEGKSGRINQILLQNKNNWETSFYIFLARNFGFNLNAEPFELLAKSLPVNYLAKHKDNLFQIEALLFGQAGFLTNEPGDEYFEQLKSEYHFLKKKFSLSPLDKHIWKFLRSRPGNFPTVRIAQFAALIHQSSSLFSKILEVRDVNGFYKLFMVKPSAYWDNHYIFNKESKAKPKSIGKSAIDILLINTVVPFLFNYAKAKKLIDLQEKSIDLLEKIKPEKNNIIDKWGDRGIKAFNASDTQALIQLKNEYCNHKKCLNCQIGNYIIRYVDEPETD